MLEADADYWPAYYNLGLLLIKTGEIDLAVENFSQVLVRVPNHPDSHLELGALYAGELNDNKLAVNHWNAFLRHAKEHPRSDEIRLRLNQL